MAEIQGIEVITNTEPEAHVHSQTQLSLNAFVYCWTLANFSACLDFTQAVVRSPKFNFENMFFRLTLYVNSKDGDLTEVKVRLSKLGKGGPGLYVKLKINLFDDDGSFTSRDTEVNFDGEMNHSHRLHFMYADEKDILDVVMKKDKLIVHCEILLLNAMSNTDSLESNVQLQRKLTTAKENCHAVPKPPRRIYKRANEAAVEAQRNLLIFMFVVLLLIYSTFPVRSVIQNQNDIKEINNLVISTTLKVINIANALNLTEIKNKSLNLLSSLGKQNIPDLDLSALDFSQNTTFQEKKIHNSQETSE